MSRQPCEVCRRRAGAVMARSLLVKRDVVYCARCFATKAEPLWMFVVVVEGTHGDVPSKVRDLISFHEGRYVAWPEILAAVEVIRGGR